MIGTIINAAIALGITYWFLAGEELTVTDPLGFILFVVLLNGFEIARLHRKINFLTRTKERSAKKYTPVSPVPK